MSYDLLTPQQAVVEYYPLIQKMAVQMHYGVWSVVTSHGHKLLSLSRFDCSVDDIVQDSAVVLMEHFDDYDPARGPLKHFVTSSVPSIVFKEAMLKYRRVRIPTHIDEKMRGILREAKKVTLDGESRYGTMVRSMASMLKTKVEPRERIYLAHFVLSNFFGNFYELDRKLNYRNINAESFDGHTPTFGERVLRSPHLEHNPEESALSHLLSGIVEEGLAQLTPREEDVLRHRYMLGKPFATIKELGAKYGVSWQAIQQTEQTAVRKFMNMDITDKLREFWRD